MMRKNFFYLFLFAAVLLMSTGVAKAEYWQLRAKVVLSGGGEPKSTVWVGGYSQSAGAGSADYTMPAPASDWYSGNPDTRMCVNPAGGEEFVGWYSDEECTQSFSSTTCGNVYGAKLAFVSRAAAAADVQITTIYAKFMPAAADWQSLAEAPTAGNYYIYGYGYGGLAGLYEYSDGKVVKGTKDPNQAVLFTLSDGTNPKISCVDEGVTKYVNQNGNYIKPEEFPAKTLVAMGDGTYMVNLNNGHPSGYTWWEMRSDGGCTYSTKNESSNTERWMFIPEAAYMNLISVESLKETGTIMINSTPTASGTTNVKFNVSDIGPVSAFECTLSGGDGNFELGTPTRKDNVITVPVTYTAHNVHSGASTPLSTATVTLTAKNDAATSASGIVSVYVNLSPQFALNAEDLDWSYDSEAALLETYYVGMEVAASERTRLQDKLVYNPAQTTGIAANFATWTATITGDDATQFKFANGTQTVSGPYTPELLDVIFAPTATGDASATLHVETSYTDANNTVLKCTKDIPLYGKGVNASIITFAADGNQSPSAAESHNFGEIIGTNAKEVTADLFIAGITNPTKVWSDPDGAFEFDESAVNLSQTNQTLTFRAHHAVSLTEEKNHTATLTISGQGAEGPVSAVLTLTYHALPLTIPTVTWNWESLNEYTTATDPVTTNSDGVWVLTKTAGDKVTYDAEAKTATTAYLHHEPGHTATFTLTIPQTDTYAAFSRTYVSTINAVNPAPIYINSQEMFDTYVEGNSWVTYDASKNAVHINIDNAYFKFSGQTVFAFDYSGYTRNTKLTEIYADGTTREIFNGDMAEGHYEIPVSPNTVKLHLYGSNDFINVHYFSYDTITVNYDKAILIRDNTTIGSLDLRAKFEGKQAVTVSLSPAARNYFVLQSEGKSSGASLVFDENDGLGVYNSQEKIVTLAMKNGADIAAAKQAADNNECFVTFADTYTYNHEEKIVPIALMDAYDVRFKHNEHGSYKVQYEIELEATTVSETDYVEHRTTIDPELCTVTVSNPVPETGYLFQGWKINGNLFSCKSSFTKMFTAETVIEPVFASLEGVYRVDDAYYDDLNEALGVAGSIADQQPVVTLMKDVLLTSGTYTIPAGVTLLIPYKANFYELQAIPEITTTATVLSAYRTLTLREGVNIVCNGNICVSGKIMAAGGGNKSAYTTGECGVINMANGGHIELNNGAHLYCWGYIKGQDMDQGNNTQEVGTITVNNGAIVQENFELGDWRGGTATSNIYFEKDEKMLFPFQSYALQNVEIPTTYKYGSKLNPYMVVHTGYGDIPFVVSIIGSEETLFLLKDEESVIRKWYDPTTDLTCYELNGTAQLDQLVLNLPFVGDFASGDCNLPISNSMHILLANCNMTLSKPLTVQAGAIIEITKTATVNLTAKIHLFDVDEWGKYIHNYYFRSFNNLTSHKDRGAENSKEGLDDAKLIIDGTLNVVNGQGYIYSTAGGANIMGNGGGVINFMGSLPSDDEIWQVNVLSGSPYITWVSTPEKAANLCNENGSYTKSTGSTSYYNIHGRWFYEDAKDELANHTYDFYYLANGNTGMEEMSSAVYSHDKTGLEAGMKWFNVEEDENCADWWVDANNYRYNYTMMNDWHQFIATENEGIFSGSDNKLYRPDACLWIEAGSVDENCLYTIGGVKKALVDGHFIPLESNGYDPAYHSTENTELYYICFSGCNWHPATPFAGESKAYTIHPEDEDLHYIWFNNDWLNVERENSSFYTADEQTNVKTYYEYVDGEWIVATPFIRVQDNMETREFFVVKEALNVASIKKDATITLLRDAQADLAPYTFNALNTTCTLDLNGHALDLTITGSGTTEVKMFAINMGTGKFTITDNSAYKTGELRLHAAPTTETQSKRWHGLYVQSGELIIEAGKVYAEDLFPYTKTSNTGMVSAVTIAAGQKFTLNGGEVEAVAPYAPYGVHMAASTNTNGKTYINDGTITATATGTTSTIGLYVGSGTAYVSGGTINATTKTTTARGIYVEGSASNYIGHLEMTGGTVTATATTTTAIGIYVGGTYSFNNTKPNTIKATFRGVANISGGTVNAEALGSTTAYGIQSLGTTKVTGGTFNVKTKTTTCEGLLVQDGTTTISGSSVFNVTATTTTAYGIYANGATPADKTGRPYNPVVTVNGGTFNVSTLGTTTAYGIIVNGATRAITSTASGNYGGNYASAGTVTVNDGVFNVTAKTTTVYAANVGKPATQAGATGYDEVTANPKCTINGGYFKLAGTSKVYALATTATTDNQKVYGGYFSHAGNLATYAAAPNIVITLPKTDANYPTYKYEIAEGYTITFMDGETELQSNNQKAGTQVVYSATEPTKANTETNSYIFDGWATEADGEMVYAKGALPNATADATYYAHFTETTLKWKVTFNPNSGVCTTDYIYVDKVDGGKAIGTLPTATRTGYTLKGWYTATSGGTILKTSTKITKDVTYYAQWTAIRHDLTWDMNGGVVTTAGQVGKSTVFPDVDATGVQTYNLSYAAAIKAPVVSRAGYTFVNWGVPTIAATMPLNDLTYTAQWKANTNTPYVVKHMQENLATGAFDEAESEDFTGTTDTYVTPKTKSYPGYVTPAAQTVQILGDGSQVVTYNYSLLRYTITWDANGGECATASTEVAHGATLTLPEATKEGYTFDGWFTKPVGGDQITDATVILRNIGTLYAHFTEEVTPETVIIAGKGEDADDEKITISEPSVEANALVVEKDGVVSFTPGAHLTVQRLVLQSTGNQSGQLVGLTDESIEVTEDVFFDFIPNGNAGTANRTWYAVAVPWEVDAENGIFLAETGRHLILGSDFDLVYYNVEKRAAEGDNPRCWTYVEFEADKVMHPGRFYMMYFGQAGWETIRFRKKDGSPIISSAPSVAHHDAATGKPTDANWNGIANPAVYHAYLNAPGVSYAQVLNNGNLDDYFSHNETSPVYKTILFGGYKFVVGKPVFVQATNDQSVVVQPAVTPSLAPRRAHAAGLPDGIEAIYQVTIGEEGHSSMDNLFVQTAQDKPDEYVIGQDLAKGGIAKKIPQLWVSRYGVKLSVNTTAPVNGIHDYPLGLSIPTSGNYTIMVESAIGEKEELYLTYDGRAIWNLSNCAYTASFDAGTIDHYGLRVSAKAPQVATGFDEAIVDAQGETRKVIINDQVFIIRGENVYSVDGQLVK